MSIGVIFVTILAVAAIGSVFYLLTQKSTKTPSVKWAVLVITFVLLWTLTNYFILDTNPTVGSIMNSFAFAVGFLALYSLFILAQYYPVKNPRFPFNKLKYFHLAAFIFAAYAALPAVAGTVITTDSGTLDYTYPSLIITYVVGAFLVLILTVIRFAQAARETRGAERAQAVLLMIGIGLAAAFALGSNTILPLLNIDISYQAFGPLVVLMTIAFISYVISRRAIFDVRPYVARSFVYAISLGILVGLFVVATTFAAQYLFAIDVHSVQTWFFAILSVVLALLFRPIINYFNEFTAKYFYRHTLDAQKVTNTVNKILVDSQDLHSQLSQISELMRVELSVVYVNFYINAQPPLHRLLAGTQTEIFKLDAWHDICKKFEYDSQQTLLAESFHEVEDKTTTETMRQFECALVQKLTSQDEIIGYMVVGYHRGGNSITSNELQVIDMIADEIAIAVQNSRRMLQIAKFNTTLQHEINRATSELQASNAKLMALDEAKDEFISMASHQLRTPLTSIKGYLSMVLEGDVGVISDPQRNFLTQAFVSSQHMAYLIGDLLNLSRIKTGKFIISTRPTYLPDVIESEISPLFAIAKARRVQLIYKKPSDFPELELDDAKIRQVIMNIAENAIYYTPPNGKITINLKKTAKQVEFTVADTGIGVTKNEQKQIFHKFYRGQNARHLRPDGTGIGLYMAKRVIDAHKGNLIFKSTEGKGSTFGFTLPLKSK